MEKYFATAAGPNVYAAAWLEASSLSAAKRLATQKFAADLRNQGRMEVLKESGGQLTTVAYRYPRGRWTAAA